MENEPKKELFVRLPVSALLDERLTRSALIVYAVLIDAADANGMTEISIAAIAERSGVSPRTVRRSERALMDAEYIRVYRTGRESVIAVQHKLRPMRTAAVRTYKRKEGKAS